ncbi:MULTISPECIES: restriction endonuclease subunit S [Bacillus]|uniref:restriction endonuclease subunit S n=1 Tax=Bacillus TaxID=1386 RepID=UPI00065BEDF4|nr:MULTISPECIES: restriction endonuclease subunit S [Bacillus cereus group]PGT05334.1 restriction endonuclease subunit S [Bacillus cereus]SCN10714.1 Type I restriction-modification system,specificity subunit S [Bacillus wiedmannii]HEF7289791.1 restriction endonuclease subunit S [Bacillus cereus]
MNQYKVKDLLGKVISGEWGSDALGENDVSVIRTTNFTNTGKINLEKEVVKRNIAEQKVKTKKLRRGDIIIEKSGGSPEQPVGRVVYFDIDEKEGIYLCNNFTSILRTNELVDSKFLFYYLFYQYQRKTVLKFQNKTTGIINLKLDNYLKDIDISLPSLREQMKIVTVLEKAQALIEKRKETIAKLDELIQVVFIDMFGDPIKNPRSYEVVQLEELISFLTSGSRGWAKYFSKEGELFITIKNVKNGQLQLGDITYVNAPVGKEAERTKVKEGDLLISITADLGRTAVISKDVASRGAYINQHLSLIRLNQKCNPRYLSSYLESVGGKRQFESLNQTGVKSGLNFAAIKSLKIVLPPLEKQDRYDVFYRKYLLEKENMITSLAMLEKSFNALLQRSFTEDIEINTEVTA